MGGGVGSRFWPLSRENNPKQFLDLFGTGKSLLRSTFDRFARFIPKENIIIITNERYKDKIREHIPEITDEQLLLEPLRRNTAPCIAYACYHINARCPEANIIVSPSDHLILNEDAFIKSLQLALEHTSKHNNIITLGIQPSRPETQYGYIQMESVSKLNELTKVKTFTEKPDLDMAKVFVDSGEFLWNSGMFVWNIKTIMEALKQFTPEITQIMDTGEQYFATKDEQSFIKENFSLCPTISIDFGIMEKADNVMVLPVDFGWADLGTWGSLYDLSEKDQNGNVSIKTRTIFHNAKGNLISSKEPKRLIVINGVDDCIVSEVDNVLLICKRSDEQSIKHLVAETIALYDKEYE